MKKVVGITLSLLLLIGAVALSSLNAESVALNLYWYQLTLPMGFLLLVFAVCGLLCGLFIAGVWWVWPAKREAVHWKRQYNQLNDKQTQEMNNQPESNQLLP
ncbi:LapA family protein [Marinicella rhabdoformis]|uniref:LapA family protein n=1 Tax=Marinicella rhabdoformis TaxID=2580566 RepID=UPI0012AEBD11|nr:LapA family protein [Marinicella rhabdoformis]